MTWLRIHVQGHDTLVNLSRVLYIEEDTPGFTSFRTDEPEQDFVLRADEGFSRVAKAIERAEGMAQP